MNKKVKSFLSINYLKKIIYTVVGTLLNFLCNLVCIDPRKRYFGNKGLVEYEDSDYIVKNRSHKDGCGNITIEWQRDVTVHKKIGYFDINEATILTAPVNGLTRYQYDCVAHVFTKYLRLLRIGKKVESLSLLKLFFNTKWRIKKELEFSVFLGYFHPDSNNYFHFWHDLIVDYWLIRKMLGDDVLGRAHLIMPVVPTDWQLEIAKMCGMSIDKIVPLSSARNFKVSRLIVPCRNKGGLYCYPWIAEAIKESCGWKDRISEYPSRLVYISRKGASRRNLINEDSVIELMVSLGFDVVDCSILTVKDQQELFSSAKFIVTPHGAALINLVWMSKDTFVLDILPENHRNPCFSDLSRLVGVNYHYLFSRQVIGSDNPLSAAVRVDLTLLKNECLKLINGFK